MMKLKRIITNLIFVTSLFCLIGCTPSEEKIRLELLDSYAEYKAIYKEYSEHNIPRFIFEDYEFIVDNNLLLLYTLTVLIVLIQSFSQRR